MIDFLISLIISQIFRSSRPYVVFLILYSITNEMKSSTIQISENEAVCKKSVVPSMLQHIRCEKLKNYSSNAMGRELDMSSIPWLSSR